MQDADASITDNNGASSSLQWDSSQLARRVEQLASIVAQQKEVIRMQSSQLNFALSFLDIQRRDSIQLSPSVVTSLSDDAITAATARNDDTKSAADIEIAASQAVIANYQITC
jgi:hypothetical protein